MVASTRVGCTATGLQSASVTVTNNSGVDSIVTASSGPIFLVGDTIPSPSKTEQFTEPGSFSGDVVITFSVTYPGQDTASYPVGPVTITFADGCEQEATTTTTAAATTTTAAPTVVVPFVYVPTTVAPTTVAPTTMAPTTVAPPTVAPVPVVKPEVAPTTAAPEQVLGAQLARTGHNTRPLTWLGLILIAVGVFALALGSRRLRSPERT